ncbi:hypothetical protein QBC39DRAFT_21233 [Podospora conica]|nr:hypothetical protein QBC39DRAFT_21233 [Schizothecium conicum]
METDLPKMVPKHCEVCHATTGLLRCSACSIYYYCGQAHQKADRATHRKTCDTIKNTKKQVDDIEARLRAQTPNPFEADRGSFWLSMTNRMYLKARYLHSEMQLRSWRQQGVEDAVDNYMGSMDLDRGDSQGIRFVVPWLFLRLGRDQQCYDFCKFWQRSFKGETSSDCRDLSVPFLDIDGADATEPVDLWTSSQFTPLAHISLLYLLKFRLRQGLEAVKTCMAANPGLSPQDVLVKIRTEYCGDILEKRPDLITDSDAVNAAMEKLDAQISCLFLASHKINEHYFKLLVKPTNRALTYLPMAYTPGSVEEAEYVFMISYSAWAESPESIQSLRVAGRDMVLRDMRSNMARARGL